MDAAVLADAVKTRLDSALRAVEDMDWTPDFGFDVEDSVRLDRCPECFDPDRSTGAPACTRITRRRTAGGCG